MGDGEQGRADVPEDQAGASGILVLDLLGFAEVTFLFGYGAALSALVTARFAFVLGFALLTAHMSRIPVEALAESGVSQMAPVFSPLYHSRRRLGAMPVSRRRRAPTPLCPQADPRP